MFYQPQNPHGLPHDPFKSCVAPRPIAWVSSVHPSGAINLAPFSFYNALASDPPLVVIGFTGYHPDGGEKDTLHNIKTSGEFVVNMVPAALKDKMNITSDGVGHDVNEAELAGLTLIDSEIVKPPRVSESPIHFECKLEQEINLPCTLENSINTSIIGQVVGIHINDDVIVDGLIDLNLINPLARLGYQQYTSVDNIFKMVRPST